MESNGIKSYSILTYLYGMNQSAQITPHLEILMKVAVEKELLCKATNIVIEDYPSMQVSLVEEQEDYSVIKNDKKIRIYDAGDKPIRLLKETNGYLFAISIKDKTIYIDGSHALGDGTTYFSFIKDLLDCYHRIKDGETLQTMGFSPYVRDDFEAYILKNDAFRSKLLSEVKPLLKKTMTHSNVIKISDDLEEGVGKYCYITLSREDLHNMAEKYAVPEYILILKWINNAIYNKSEDVNKEKDIEVSFVVNMRGILKEKELMGNCVASYPITFVRHIRDFEDEYRHLYEQMRRQLRKNLLLETMKLEADLTKEISQLSSRLRIKKKVYERVFRGGSSPTYWLSVNEDYLAELNSHKEVENIYAWNDPVAAQMGVEMIPYDSYINLCISYQMKEDIVIQEIINMMEQNGMTCSVGDVKPYRKVAILPEVGEAYE